MMSIPDTRQLLVSLLYILQHCRDPLAKKIVSTHFPSKAWPVNANELPYLKGNGKVGKNVVKPSIHAGSSERPIRDTDVWQLVKMLRNVDGHDDFLRLIGVAEKDVVAKTPYETEKPSKPRRRNPTIKKKPKKK